MGFALCRLPKRSNRNAPLKATVAESHKRWGAKNIIMLETKTLHAPMTQWLKKLWWALTNSSDCCGAALEVWDYRHIYCSDCNKQQ